MFKFLTQKPAPIRAAQNALVEEIHHTFYTEVERLRAIAGQKSPVETDKQELLDKAKRLRNAGFIQAAETKEAGQEEGRLIGLRQSNHEKAVLIKVIDYFGFRYPNYKFITEESVKKICSKYGLIYGPVQRYTGTVPEENLRHVEAFKIKPEDECWLEISSFGSSDHTAYVSHQKVNPPRPSPPHGDASHYFHYVAHIQNYHHSGRTRFEVCGLEIAAPAKDFDMRGMEVKNFVLSKIEVPDPVVLKPVFFGGQKHYLIVTAWGLEAGDEAVVNHKMN